MVTKTRVLLGILASGGVLTAGCGFGSGDEAGGDGVFEAKTMDVEDLPVAGGRTAFAISDEIVLVGGGGVPTDDGIDPSSSPHHSVPQTDYTPLLDVWEVERDGQATSLPPLPSERAVSDLSGAQVGDSLVLTGRECTPSSAAWACDSQVRPMLWTRDTGEALWTSYELSDQTVPTPDVAGELGENSHVEVLGAHDGKAVLAFRRDDDRRTVQFLTFDPDQGTFAAIGDGTGADGAGRSQHCVTGEGDIWHLGYDDEAGDADGKGPTSVTVTRLTMAGERSPEVRFDPVSPWVVSGASIACPAGRDPVLLVREAPVRKDGSESADPLADKEPDTTLATLRAEGADGSVPVTISEVGSFRVGLDSFGDGANVVPGIIGSSSAGEVVVQITSGPAPGLYSFTEEAGFSRLVEVEPASHIQQVFVQGDVVGTLSGWGEVQLHRPDSS